jgi:hypothetical protein
MSDKLTYLASPYSKYPGGREAAYEAVCKKAAELMLEGENIFCPIAHSHPVETIGGIDPEKASHDFWLKQDFAVLAKCDKLIVYMMTGWETSFGVQAEIAKAKELNIPIEFYDCVDAYTPLTKIVNTWAYESGRV